MAICRIVGRDAIVGVFVAESRHQGVVLPAEHLDGCSLSVDCVLEILMLLEHHVESVLVGDGK